MSPETNPEELLSDDRAPEPPSTVPPPAVPLRGVPRRALAHRCEDAMSPTEKAAIAWEDPPKFCPRCGGSNIVVAMVPWHAESLEDKGNTGELEEHQCVDCDGASFWT
jgi:hypothetical protein